MAKRTEQMITVDGRTMKLSNLEKVLYPEVGFTKGQVVDFFVRIAPWLLPHVEGRPLTLKRYPNGVNGMFFYEKNCPEHRPDWVQTAPIWSEGNQRIMHYCLAQDVPTLIWAANLADLELHTSLSLASDMDHPTCVVFDLDPGAPADMVQCCQVGMWIKKIFDELKLESFAKTSGSKGLQVYVPLNSKRETYAETKPFARAIARLLEETHPELVVSDMKKALRVGKILVDWSQNDIHKTTVATYSLRAKTRPTVSTPVTWEEVERCFKKKYPKLLVFETTDTLKRCEELGDIFAPVLKLKQRLPALSALGIEPEKRRKVGGGTVKAAELRATKPKQDPVQVEDTPKTRKRTKAAAPAITGTKRRRSG